MGKKELASLLDGIMGDDYKDKETAAPKRPGRPKAVKKEEIRATFLVDIAQLKKIKYISLCSNMMQKEIVYDALKSYIDFWESNHGKINLPS